MFLFFCMVGALLAAYVFLVYMARPFGWIMLFFVRRLTFLSVG